MSRGSACVTSEANAAAAASQHERFTLSRAGGLALLQPTAASDVVYMIVWIVTFQSV